MEGSNSILFTGLIVLVCQLAHSVDGQFFDRFTTRSVKGLRLPVVNDLIRGRGQFDHFVLPPQRNISGPVKVLYSLGLIRIIDLDEQNLVLTFMGLERYNWQDRAMTFSDTDKSPLVLPRDGVWIPDFKVLGSLNPAREYDHMARPLVYGTGEVMWLPKVKHVIGCTGSSREIVCSMKVISWHYSGNQVEPDFYNKVSDFDMANYEEHPRWQLAGHEARRNVKRVAGNTDVFVELIYTLRLRRK